MMVNVSKLTNYMILNMMADVTNVLKSANVKLYMLVNISKVSNKLGSQNL